MPEVIWQLTAVLVITFSLCLRQKEAANVGGSEHNEVQVETTTVGVPATTARGLVVSEGPANFTVQAGKRVTLICQVDNLDVNTSLFGTVASLISPPTGCSRSVKTSTGRLRKPDPCSEELMKYVRCRRDVKLSICLLDDGTVHPCCEPPRVVIIGAGMAGLSAAQRFVQCGMNNFVILEATDRAGGRIHSCYMDKVVAEMGATFIRGASVNNPAFVLASMEGLIPDPPSMYGSGRGLCLTSRGFPVPEMVNHTAIHSYKFIMEQAAELYGKTAVGLGSIWDFIANRIHQETAVYPEPYRRFAAKFMFGATNEARGLLGADLSKVAASQFGSYAPLPGGDMRIPSGMVGILAPLFRCMPECSSILYCKPVEKIIWTDKVSDTERVKVVCCDGSTFPADYVIVTVSLGVLKERAKTMFQPALPQSKLDAIDKLGFGHVCQIYFEYARPFWLVKEGAIRLGWSLEELRLREQCIDWVRAIDVIDETPGTEQALNVTVSDEEAKCVEKLADTKIAEDITRLLRQFTGDGTLPYPENIVKSQWSSDKYHHGARAYIQTGSTVADQCELSMPVPDEGAGLPALFFAGEATATGAYGSVHGARMSGIREAERILLFTRKAQGKPKPDTVETASCKDAPAKIAVKA